MPRYQTYPLGDASAADAATADSPDVQAALEAAYDAGCLTRPTQFPYDASAGASGDAGELASAAGNASSGASGSSGDPTGAAGEH